MTTQRLFVFVFFLVLFARSVVAPVDADIWWHLRTGEHIVNNGIPEEDPGFSFVAEGREWFMHEWLSEVVMWVVYEIGEFEAIIIFFALIIATIFYILYFAADNKPFVAAFVTIFGYAASSVYLGPRPQMFNLLLAALYVLIIEKVRLKQVDRRWMYLLPPLAILWANLHSGFLLGPVILGVYIVGGIIENIVNTETRLSWSQIRFFSLIGLGIVVGSLVNPQTYRLWLYPFVTTFNSEFMQTFIEEWLSPDFHDIRLWGFAAYILMGVVILARTKRTVTPTELLFVIGTLATSLQQGRNVPVHVIVTAPIYSRHAVSAFGFVAYLANLKPQTPGSLKRNLNIGLLIFFIFGALIFASEILTTYEEVVEEKFPDKTVQFLKENELDKKRIFNSYNWGGYLIWHKIPTFVDGRADLYGDDLLFDYVAIQFGREEWHELLEEYEIDLIMIDRQSPLDELVKLVDKWQVVFEEDEVIVYQNFENEENNEGNE